MSEQVIPAEAVEAAGYAELNGEVVCNFISEDLLRAALEAAAPFMLNGARRESYETGVKHALAGVEPILKAEGWDEGWDAFASFDSRPGGPYPTNPYGPNPASRPTR